MCGIYGITKRDPGFIRSYIDSCSHRGPDGSDIWYDDHVTLGHNLLSITSEPEVGKQPWHTDKGNVLIYNGEIFNYDHVVWSYRNSGWIPKTTCDTELLAFLLDSFYVDIVNSNIIDSMHAYAYYDKEQKTITLSRDHAGIKPLFYAETSDGLVFGSEIKGMIDKVPGARCIDEFASASMSYSGINISANTMFKGIKKVLPGQTLVYDIHKQKFTRTSRWVIKPTSKKGFDPEEFRQEVHETVKMCTLGMRKFGVFLSGGLDSTMIAHELNKILPSVDSFTNEMNPNVIIGEDHNDDAKHAKWFADHYGFNHHPIQVTPETVKSCWDDSMFTMEQPVYNMSMPMYYHTNKVLSQHDVVVTMAGDMGDELLGGYPKYWKLKNNLPTSFEECVWRWMHRIKRPVQLSKKVDAKAIHGELCKIIPQELWNPEDPINSYMAIDCITQVPEEFFSRNDQFGMKFGMEGRFPLATQRFMKYCMDIHADHKIGKDKSDTKLLSKIAYKGHMPDYIINKMKTGWTVPLIYWMGTNKDLDDFAMSYMNADDCLKNTVSMDNWKNKKTRVISWMMRSWAQRYSMTL